MPKKFLPTISAAYGVKEQQVDAPDWLEAARFDIAAKLPHKEQRPMPIYALVVAKGGAKLKSSGTEGKLNLTMAPKGRQLIGRASMDRLAETISQTLDRPVIDMTNWKGAYDIDVAWTPDETDTLNAKMMARTGGAMGSCAGRSCAGDGQTNSQ